LPSAPARTWTRNAFHRLFGEGKGSGAAFLFAVIGVAGVAVCLVFQWLLRGETERERKNK
ncbi:MAG: hypothetical protein NC078_08905, partial [Ruminococcus sp.]|nr:hypothetical protein [Ruminococcus sp.]